ncbi:EAL domain-containing protein [Massilia sp. H-1]|nr:EAL domain-containing protein [Massilia sp. H-1]
MLEETGLIVPVGTWVINEACRMISKWGKSRTGPVHLSVNVSGVQFFLGGLEEEVLNAIKVHEIAPELLELELTESSLMSNAEDTITVLRNLEGARHQDLDRRLRHRLFEPGLPQALPRSTSSRSTSPSCAK